MSLMGSCSIPSSSRWAAAASNSSLLANAEGYMIQSAAVLVEPVGRDGPKANQRAAEVVDHAAEQKSERLLGCRVGALGRLDQHRPAEHALVELSRPLDVGDGKPDVRNGAGVDRHGPMLPVTAER